MRPAEVRALRAGLLALVIGLAGAVTWLLRHSPAGPPPPSTPPAAMAARTEHLVYRTFKGDKVNFTLQAESEVGRRSLQVDWQQLRQQQAELPERASALDQRDAALDAEEQQLAGEKRRWEQALLHTHPAPINERAPPPP